MTNMKISLQINYQLKKFRFVTNNIISDNFYFNKIYLSKRPHFNIMEIQITYPIIPQFINIMTIFSSFFLLEKKVL